MSRPAPGAARDDAPAAHPTARWVVRVAIDRPIDTLFDYLYAPFVPPTATGTPVPGPTSASDRTHAVPKVGERLRVPLRGQTALGIVVDVRPLAAAIDSAGAYGADQGPDESAPRNHVRPLDQAQALDRDAALDASVVALARFVARHYHQPLGRCLAAALPPAWRRPDVRDVTVAPQRPTPPHYRLTPAGRAVLADRRPSAFGDADGARSQAVRDARFDVADATDAGRGLQAQQIDLLETIHRVSATPDGALARPPARDRCDGRTATLGHDPAPARTRIERLIRRGLVEVVDAPVAPSCDGAQPGPAGGGAPRDDLMSPPAQRRGVAALTAAQRRVFDDLLGAWHAVRCAAPAATNDVDAAGEPPPRPAASPDASDHGVRVSPERAPSGVVLLEGVTGSGKTRLYEALIGALFAHAEADGRPAPGVLVLTPEIGLTPQLVQRLRDAFGDTVVESHSGQSAAERARVFGAVRAGRHRIVVGTRSAIFMPVPNLALIVVDEEHDAAYKQTQSPLYNARDLAVWRGRHAGALVVLGSATPSLESLVNAAAGRYRHVTLEQRPDGSAPPRLHTVDLRRHPPDEGLSAPLLDAIAATLARDEHVFLLLNRRGYAPALLCTACGWNADCPRCDAHLTVHHGRTPHQAARAARLRCHHCGHGAPAPHRCPNCGTPLDVRGLGTQRVERALAAHFPQRDVLRLDRDALAGPRDLARAFQRLRSERGLIVVGTQLIAKGHDFPDVGLVGIVDADAGWFSADLRAAEHTAQQILQVAGRARRRVLAQPDASRPAAPVTAPVLLQTWVPEHPIVRALAAGRWAPVAEHLLADRRAAGLPPFGRAALVRLDGRDAQHTQSIARTLTDHLRAVASEVCADAGVRILGPAPALIARIHDRHREHILLLGRYHAALHPLLDAAVEAFGKLKTGRRVRLTLDVDPLSLS